MVSSQLCFARDEHAIKFVNSFNAMDFQPVTLFESVLALMLIHDALKWKLKMLGEMPAPGLHVFPIVSNLFLF